MIAELREEVSDPASKDVYLDTNALSKRWSMDRAYLSNMRVSNQGPKFFKLGGKGKVLYDLKDILEYEKANQ